jgi:hypothetical protein
MQWVIETMSVGRDLMEKSAAGRTLLWMKSNAHKGDRDLLQLLYHLRSSLSSDPKDKIYGVLGLASDAGSVVPHVNYEWSLETIHAELFKTMANARGNLDLLTLASGVTDSKLPSWCPDLTRSRLVSMNTCRSVQAQKPFGFRAARDSKPVIQIGTALGNCSMEGYLVDEIDGLGAGIRSQSKLPPLEDGFVQPQFEKLAYATDEETFDAIWTSLVADQDFEGTEESWRAPSMFGMLYASEGCSVLHNLGSDSLCFQTWIEQNAEFRLGRRTIGEWTTFLGNKFDTTNTLAKHGFYRRLESTISGRRMMTTVGGYVGIVKDDVRRGDRVCLLSGGRMPVILRPAGDSFYFIGESYIHGMMLGELWPHEADKIGARRNISII